MEKAPTLGLMEKNILESGKMVIKMDKEPILGQMEKNMLVNTKMMNFMGKELLFFLKGHIMFMS